MERENKNMRINELMLYKHMEDGHILQDMAFLMENYKSDYYNQEAMGSKEISGIIILRISWQAMKTLTVPPARS